MNGPSVLLAEDHADPARPARPERSPCDSEARCRAIVESAEEGIVQVDGAGCIRFANARLARMLDVAPAELSGRAFVDLFDPGHSCDAARLLTPRPGARRSAELRLQPASGPAQWVIAVAGNLADSGARDTVVVLTDISARRLAEAELRQLTEQLEQCVEQGSAQLDATLADLEALNHAVAHDLRTPLNAIAGFATLLQARDDVWSDEHKRQLGLIRDTASGINELVGGLLRLARVTRQTLRIEPLDLSAMVEAIAVGLGAADPQRRMRWQIERGAHAHGDPALMRNALTQLLHNAWKYTTGRQQPQIAFETRAAPQRGIEYVVRDNGIGFAMASAERLFMPFGRPGSARAFAGHGLGLATVRRIVERHGGSVRADSAPGAGASFIFTLAPLGA